MQLEVGMFVRTKQGEIHKIKSINNEFIEYENGFGVPYEQKDYIVNANYNPKNLVEIGDYVDGYLVNEVYRPDGNEVFRIEIERCTLRGHIIDYYSPIKSIVTKEQFESMAYKVNE